MIDVKKREVKLDYDKKTRELAKTLNKVYRPTFIAKVLGITYQTFYNKIRGWYKFNIEENIVLSELYDTIKEYIE